MSQVGPAVNSAGASNIGSLGGTPSDSISLTGFGPFVAVEISGDGFTLDDLSIDFDGTAVVPEPASFGLTLLGGLAGLVLRRRTTRRRPPSSR